MASRRSLIIFRPPCQAREAASYFIGRASLSRLLGVPEESDLQFPTALPELPKPVKHENRVCQSLFRMPLRTRFENQNF